MKPRQHLAAFALGIALAAWGAIAEAGTTFVWRAEGSTLDATADFTVNDNSATLSNASIAAAAACNGSSGLQSNASAVGTADFTPTTIIDNSTTPTNSHGSAAFKLKFATAVPGANQAIGFRAKGTTNNDAISVQTLASQELALEIRHATNGAIQLATTAANLAADTCYWVVIRWDIPNDDRKIEVYNGSTGALIDSAQDLSTDLSTFAPASMDTTLQLGIKSASNTNASYTDNFIISDSYSAPLQNFYNITSYQPAYTAGPTFGTATTTTLPFTYTPNQDGVTYAAACTNGQTISTGANVESGTCSGGAAICTGNDSSTAGVGDTVTITGCDAGTTYDVYVVHKSTLGGYSTLSSQADKATTGSACSGTPSVTDVDTDESVTATQANIVITGTTFCASQGTGSVQLVQGANTKTLSIDSWSATSIQADMSGVGMGVANGLLYGSMSLRVNNDAGNNGSLSITATAPSGTIFNDLAGPLVALTFDFNTGAPSRPYGSPLDMQDTSQLALRNAVGCTIASAVTINEDGSLTLSDTCDSVDFDYSRSGLYVGTASTQTFTGMPVTFAGDMPDRSYVRNVAISPFNSNTYFAAGDVAISAYALRQLTSTTARTLVNGGGVGLQSLVVDSVANISVDDFIDCAGSEPARVKYVDPFNLVIGLWTPLTCVDDAAVNERGTGAGAVTGLTLNAGSGQLTGTPTVIAVTSELFIRATDADSLIATGNPFRIDVHAQTSNVGGKKKQIGFGYRIH